MQSAAAKGSMARLRVSPTGTNDIGNNVYYRQGALLIGSTRTRMITKYLRVFQPGNLNPASTPIAPTLIPG